MKELSKAVIFSMALGSPKITLTNYSLTKQSNSKLINHQTSQRGLIARFSKLYLIDDVTATINVCNCKKIIWNEIKSKKWANPYFEAMIIKNLCPYQQLINSRVLQMLPSVKRSPCYKLLDVFKLIFITNFKQISNAKKCLRVSTLLSHC